MGVQFEGVKGQRVDVGAGSSRGGGQAVAEVLPARTSEALGLSPRGEAEAIAGRQPLADLLTQLRAEFEDMSTVFISYRRADEPFAVEEIERSLAEALGQDEVFRDTSDIAATDDFRHAMTVALERHSVVIVVIGRSWNLQRLFHPDDNVRFEIETAFRLAKRVVPVLVGDARWPNADDLPPSLRPLATLSYLPFRAGLDLERDTDAILSAVISTRPLLLSGVIKPLRLQLTVGTVPPQGQARKRLPGAYASTVTMRSAKHQCSPRSS